MDGAGKEARVSGARQAASVLGVLCKPRIQYEEFIDCCALETGRAG
jgi:hypothetical protein